MRKELPNSIVCATRAIPGTNLSDCLVESPHGCTFALSFGEGHLCKNPERLKFDRPKQGAFGEPPILKLAAQVIQYVRASTDHNFSFWNVGVMQDVEAAYCAHNRPRTFNFWAVVTIREALENCEFLVQKMGLKSLPLPALDSLKKTYVYIFSTESN